MFLNMVRTKLLVCKIPCLHKVGTSVHDNKQYSEVLYLIDFREFDSLLQGAAPTDGGYVEHSIPELNERSPAGGGCLVTSYMLQRPNKDTNLTWFSQDSQNSRALYGEFCFTSTYTKI